MLKKILALIVSLIVSAYNGVSYVPVSPDPITPTSYYKGNQGLLDFRQMYSLYFGSKESMDDELSADAVYLGEGDTVTSIGPYNFRWVVANQTSATILEILNTEDFISVTSTEGPLKVQSEVIFDVPVGSKIVFPTNGELVKTSLVPDNVYPQSNNTRGNKITYYSIDYVRGKVFKVTLGSLEKYWYHIPLTEPDYYAENDNNKPVYSRTVNLPDKVDVIGGTVVGIAGHTSMSSMYEGNEYLYFAVEVAQLQEGVEYSDSYFRRTSIGEYYGIE